AGLAHPGAADPVVGRALDPHARRLPGVSRPARAGVRPAVAPVSSARVRARPEAARHARGASPHAGDPGRAAARARDAEPVRRGDPAAGATGTADRARGAGAGLDAAAPITPERARGV